MMSESNTFARLRYQYLPDHLIGEILSKRWIDNAIPFLALVITVGTLSSIIPDFLSMSSLSDLARQFAEFGLIVLALSIVMMSGGIDLSVASVFTVAVLFSLIGINVYELSVPVTLLVILVFGMSCGAVNGVLIGYLRLRAFLTTLVTLIIFRSIYEIVFLRMSTSIMSGFSDSDLWLFIGEGTVAGIPVSLLITLSIALACHIVLSRMRPGWRLTAVGGARRSAYNAGIDVRRIVFFTYVASGTMCALAGFLFAARIGSTGSDTGVGLEVQALTAAVLGGNSIGGGRGSVAKAIIGALLVLMLTNGLINLGISGPVTSTILGAVLLLAVFVDMRWQKHRHRLLAKIYVSPGLSPAAGACERHRAGLALRVERSPALGRNHRPRPDRGTGGCHPRPRRQSLLRHAAWRHRPLLRTRSQTLGGLRAYWRASAWAWPSIVPAICWSASAAWAFSRLRPTRPLPSSPMKPIAACSR